MTESIEIPLARITSVGRGRVIHQHDAAVLVTAPGQWNHSAEAVFDVSGLEKTGRIVTVNLQVERGEIGVGWLNAQGSDWVARSFIGSAGVPSQVALALPRGTPGGKLVIETATEGGSSAVAILEGIRVCEAEDAPITSFGTGSAEFGGRTRWLGEIKAAFHIGNRQRVPSAKAIERFEQIFKNFDSPDELLALADPTPAVQNFVKSIWEFAHGKTTLTAYPWNISLPVADLCNARCSFCTSWLDGRKVLDLDKLDMFEPVLRTALYIGLVGHGEPMAHPQFDELCDRLAALCDPISSVYTITNGSFLDKWRDHLERINLHSYSVSLNAATPATHDIVMGLGRNAFPRIIESIAHLIETGKRSGQHRDVYITMVVTKQNIAEIPAFIELGNQIGVSEIWLRSLLPQSGLIPGLNYHELPPYHHPDFEALRRSAVAAIAASTVPVQADPGLWGQRIFSEALEQQILLAPPPRISREKALRDRELRQRNQFLYHQKKGVFRGHALAPGSNSEIRWAEGRLQVLTPKGAGAYAAAVPVIYPEDGVQDIVVEVELDCDEGALGLGLLDEETNSWLARAIASPGSHQVIRLNTTAKGQAIQLVIHNGREDDIPTCGSIGRAHLKVEGIGQSLPVDWGNLIIHNAADPLDDGTNPLGREARFACKAVYYNLYVNEFFYRVNPCCYLQQVPGFEEVRLDGDMTFMKAWNSPGMVELRRRLAEGPLFGACMRCPEKW